MIKLNIGGYKYCTSKTTLLSTKTENFFNKLLNGDIPSEKDENGAYFIDRNGKMFEPILDYLRTGVLILPRDVKLVSVLEEANFYLIDLAPAFCGELKEGLYYSHKNALYEMVFVERDKKRPYLFAITGNIRRKDDDTGGQELQTFIRRVCEVKDGVIECEQLRIYPDKHGLRIVNPEQFEHDVKLDFICGKEKSAPQVSPDHKMWKQYGEAKGLFFSKAKSKSDALTVQYGTHYREKANCYQVEILCSKFLIVKGKGKPPGTGFIYVQDNQKLWLYGSPILNTRRWEYFTKEQNGIT